MHNCVYLRQFSCKENCPQLPYNWKPISSQLTCICMSGWLFLRLLTPALCWTQIKGIQKKVWAKVNGFGRARVKSSSPSWRKTRVLNDKSSITAAWHHWHHEFQGHSRKEKKKSIFFAIAYPHHLQVPTELHYPTDCLATGLFVPE